MSMRDFIGTFFFFFFPYSKIQTNIKSSLAEREQASRNGSRFLFTHAHTEQRAHTHKHAHARTPRQQVAKWSHWEKNDIIYIPIYIIFKQQIPILQ